MQQLTHLYQPVLWSPEKAVLAERAWRLYVAEQPSVERTEATVKEAASTKNTPALRVRFGPSRPTTCHVWQSCSSRTRLVRLPHVSEAGRRRVPRSCGGSQRSMRHGALVTGWQPRACGKHTCVPRRPVTASLNHSPHWRCPRQSLEHQDVCINVSCGGGGQGDVVVHCLAGECLRALDLPTVRRVSPRVRAGEAGELCALTSDCMQELRVEHFAEVGVRQLVREVALAVQERITGDAFDPTGSSGKAREALKAKILTLNLPDRDPSAGSAIKLLMALECSTPAVGKPGPSSKRQKA